MNPEYQHMGPEELRDEFDRLTERRRRIMRQAADLADKAKGEGREITEGEQTKLGDLNRGLEKLNDDLNELEYEITDKERRNDQLLRLAQNPGNILPGDGNVPLPGTRTYGEREQSLRAIDRVHDRGDIPDPAAERAEALVRNGNPRDRSIAARWVAVTSDDHYRAAFAKMCADPEKGHLLWTREEHDAFQRAEEFRAMSLTDTAGGFLVPFQLDPSIILTSAGSINPLRQISRVVNATGDVWHGVSSAGVSAEWIAEATEVADATPTLAQPEIPVFKGDAFVPFSFEVGMDAADLMGELGPLLTDAADQLQATAFTTGVGTTQPTGIITALDGSASEVAPATVEVFAKADVYALQNALPPRFQARAQWCANIAILNTMSQFETTAGARLFPELGEGRLLRKPINELSNMDGAINPAATADNFILLYGDFRHFVIADRIGSTVEFIPHLFATGNNRPSGQRGVLLWFRTGSDSVADNAFRVLNVATTA